MNTMEQEERDMKREAKAYARAKRAQAKAQARKARLDLRAYNVMFERRWVVSAQKLIKAGNGGGEFDLKGAYAFIERVPKVAPSRKRVRLGALLGGPLGALLGALVRADDAEEMISVVIDLADGEILEIPSRASNMTQAKVFVNAVNQVSRYKG